MGRPTVVALKSNSVFDWADGSERSGGDDLDDLPITHKTRYNLNPRIIDITDLVEESSDGDIDNSIKVGRNEIINMDLVRGNRYYISMPTNCICNISCCNNNWSRFNDWLCDY